MNPMKWYEHLFGILACLVPVFYLFLYALVSAASKADDELEKWEG